MATRLSQWNKAAPALVEQRAARRYHVRVERAAIATAADAVVRGELHDVSTYGCRLSLDTAPAIGEPLRILLGNAAPIVATVVWAEDGMIGCRFAAPLARGLSRALTLGIHPVANA